MEINLCRRRRTAQYFIILLCVHLGYSRYLHCYLTTNNLSVNSIIFRIISVLYKN